MKGAPGRASIAGLVLAAGRSTRMGARNKLLVPVRGKPMLRHAVEAQLAAGASPVIVVTGHQAGEVAGVLAGLDIRLVHNRDFATGLSGSLKAGIAALPRDVAGVVVSLGDMPDITGAIIGRLVAAFRDTPDALATVPVLHGQRGNPVLLSRALFDAVGGLSGDQGARRLLADAGDAVVEIALDDPAIAFDVDTPEVLAGLSKR